MSIHNDHPVILGDLLHLQTPTEPFQLKKALLHVIYAQGSSVEVDMHITFEGDEDLWSEIQQRRLFGVEPENIGSIWGGTFAQDKPLIFELRPRTTTTTLAGILTDHPLDVAIHIIESPTTSEFRKESTYKLIAVKQEMFEGVFTGLQIQHPEMVTDESEYEISGPIERNLDPEETTSLLIEDFLQSFNERNNPDPDKKTD